MALTSLLDHLYCHEEELDVIDVDREDFDDDGRSVVAVSYLPLAVAGDGDLEHLFGSLKGKEEETRPKMMTEEEGGTAAQPYLMLWRRGALEWVTRAAARLGFSPLVALLAGDYLDRCFIGGALRLQNDKPWMARLASLACLSLAAKVEETRVPLLIDLQLCAAGADGDCGGGAYVFEARTVRRMELLVLAALKWRMHPVTALSYLHPLLPSLAGGAVRLRRCEAALLSAMADWRWVLYPASAWAAAALAFTSERGAGAEYLIPLLNAPDEDVQCCRLMMSEAARAEEEALDATVVRRCKRPLSPPASPCAVVGTCFSREGSTSSCTAGDAWLAWQFPEAAEPPRCKRGRRGNPEASPSLDGGGGEERGTRH